MQNQLIFLISVLISAVAVMADMEFTAPKAGKAFTASGGKVSVDIKWDDDGSDLNFKDIEKYTVSLCTGPNNDIECTELEEVKGLTKKSYTASIDASAFPNGWYYFQMYNTYDLGISILYTDRFQLKGMDGGSKTFGSTMLLTVSLTATGEAPGGATQGDDKPIDTRSHTVPYTKQTGKTRYAPMQTQPGKSITYTSMSRRFATSSYSAYSTYKKSPNVMTTLTPSWDYTAASKPNGATVAPYPNTAYPASERITASASLTSAAKKRRWLD
ncbi:unnamed protein product [Debaryomyces tyrocola]|nr:unnamed protein product [Debaryomyces tyrocola]